MKIFIAGSNGDIGKELVKLLKKKHKIFLNLRNKKNKNLNKNLLVINHDFKQKLKSKISVDIVINCIAAHEFSKKNKLIDLLNSNIIAMKNLIDFSKINKTKLFINLSTVAVYGNHNKTILTEEVKTINQGNLGLTKLIGEKILEKSNLNYINLRLPGVLTKSKNYDRPWLKTIINNIKLNKPVKVFNSNTRFNNVIDVYEIYRFVDFIISKNMFKKKIRKTFNFSASFSISLIKLLKVIKGFYNSKSKINILKSNKKPFTISVNKLYKVFKFLPSSTEKMIVRNLS